MKAVRSHELATPTPTLRAPEPMPSVQEIYGNAAAQEALTTGSAGSLPYLAEMQAAFGTDFSDVRAVFGADLESIGASAAADGTLVAFAEANPDRETVAHELTHVVQARGTSGGTDGVSSPGDAAEVEARDTAKAVARGEDAGEIRATASGVHRQELPKRSYANQEPPKKSYIRGDLPTWKDGSPVTEEHYKQLLDRQIGALGAALTLSTKVVGLALTGTDESLAERLTKTAKGELEGEIELRKAELGHYESEVEYLEDLDVRNARQDQILQEKRARLPTLRQELETIESGADTALEKAADAAQKVASGVATYAGSVAQVGAAFSGGIAGLTPSQFSGIDDALGKIDMITKAARLAATFADAKGIQAFRDNPSFETAKAWGAEVGEVFNEVSGLVAGFPSGWGTVISGALQMPGKVIAGFTSLMEQRRAALDAALSGYGCRKSEMLEEGTTSSC